MKTVQATTLPDNAKDCGQFVRFEDSAGKFIFVSHEDLTEENLDLYSNPTALGVFNASRQEFLDGQAVDIEYF